MSIWVVLTLLAAVLSVLGIVIVRANTRQKATLARNEARIAQLPPEYRRSGLPVWWSLLGLVGAIAAMVVAGLLWGELAGILALGLAMAPVAWFALRHEEIENKAIAREVERRAPEMSPAELRTLIDDIEAAHGRGTMRHLRRLIPSRG